MQGTYGLDILKYTETVEAVATRVDARTRSCAGSATGSSTAGPARPVDRVREPATRSDPCVLLAGYGLVVARACSPPAFVRWRHRVVLRRAARSSGSSSRSAPSPVRRPDAARRGVQGVRDELDRRARAAQHRRARSRSSCSRSRCSSASARTRSSTRCAGAGTPVLGGAVLGVVVRAHRRELPRALRRHASTARTWSAPENVPDVLDAGDRSTSTRGRHDTRILEEPGTDFASYTWGNTVDPITPGLTDRPYVARELIPYGTPGSADLLERDRPPLPGGRRRPGGAGRAAAAHGRRRRRRCATTSSTSATTSSRPASSRACSRRSPGSGRPIVFGPPTPSSAAQGAARLARGRRDRPRRARRTSRSLQSGRGLPGRPIPTPIVRAESAAHGR